MGQIGVHRKRCEKMAGKYGRLYDEWLQVQEFAVMEDDVEEWKNMRALYEHFRGRFIEGIENERATKKRIRANAPEDDGGMFPNGWDANIKKVPEEELKGEEPM